MKLFLERFFYSNAFLPMCYLRVLLVVDQWSISQGTCFPKTPLRQGYCNGTPKECQDCDQVLRLWKVLRCDQVFRCSGCARDHLAGNNQLDKLPRRLARRYRRAIATTSATRRAAARPSLWGRRARARGLVPASPIGLRGLSAKTSQRSVKIATKSGLVQTCSPLYNNCTKMHVF